jgi:hypothetical protein
MELNEDLCEFVGAIIGDGCVDSYTKKSGKSSYHISFTGDPVLDKSYLCETMPKLISKLFNVRARPIFRKTQNGLVLNIYSKKVFSLLTKRFNFPIGSKTLSVKILNEIIEGGDRFIYSTIRGIADTDGCVFLDKRKAYKKPYARIHLVTYSRPLFEQLKEIFGKEFSIYFRESMAEVNMRYDIVIYGNRQLKKWMDLIGFSNERHLKKVRIVLEPLEGFEPPTSGLQNPCYNQLSYRGGL